MPVVGLDLGSHNFRAVELERARGFIKLNKIGSYDNPKLNLDSISKADLDTYADAIRNFFAETGFSSPHVVVGLKERNVFMHFAQLPNMKDKEMRKAVEYEAEQNIPSPIEEVSLSHQKLDPVLTDREKVNVQIVAARKTILEKYVEILKKARLTPRAIEPETLAMGRVLGDTQDVPIGTIILDFGFEASLVVITYGGFVRFTRSVPIGGKLITRSVQQDLNLDYLQAEEYKKIYGLDQSQVGGKIFAVVKPLVDSIILEVKRASVFFTKQNPSATIKKLIITGGTAQMPSLLVYIANNLDLEVEIANPFKNITVNPKDEKALKIVSEQQPLFSVAVGLAMKDL